MKQPTGSQLAIQDCLTQLRESLRGCIQTTQPSMPLPTSITQLCDALIECYTSRDDPYLVRNLSDRIDDFLEQETHANERFVILAANAPAAEVWARERRLTPKQWFYASSPMRVTGISNVTVVTLPGFETHRDRHAIRDMIDRAKGTGTVVEYAEATVPPKPTPPPTVLKYEHEAFKAI